MPSAEHEFLARATLDAIDRASESRLFAYRESQRKEFDLAGDVTRVTTKSISGRVIWNHDRNDVVEDLGTLLHDEDASAVVYVARDVMATRSRVTDAVSDHRDSPMRERLERLRVFWIPADFDADDATARARVAELLGDEVRRGLVMRVALGGLDAEDVRHVAGSRRVGLPVWMLAHLASVPVDNPTRWAKDTGISVSTLKEESLRLEASGMVDRAGGLDYRWRFSGSPSMYRLTDKGRALLDVASRIHGRMRSGAAHEAGFEEVCELLGLRLRDHDLGAFSAKDDAALALADRHPAARLLAHVACASDSGRVDWPAAYYGGPET